jgi:diguanylate cyclase (GGDEF)-like protein
MALTLAGLLAGLFLISRTIVLGGFAHLEEEDVRENVTRFQEALSEEVTQIDRTAGDWAPWDDTYTFIEDGNQEYIDSNLIDDTLVNLDVNLMLFVHSSGRPVFSKAVDLEQGSSVPISASVEQELVANDFLLSHKDTDSSISGIMLLPEGPLLVASQPILTSDGQGPIRGTLIMGRYLDAAKLQELAARTQLSVQVHRRDDADIPPDFQPAFSSLEGDSVFVQPLDRDSIAGYALLYDVYGQPALTLRIDMPREIYQQGTNYTLYLIVALSGLGLTFGLVVVFLLERFVLRRLASLRAAVKRIGASGDLTARVPVAGNDELSDLGAAINTTLNALERSQAERQRAQEELRLLNERLVKEQQEVEALNRSLEAKVRERTKELRLANEELRGRNSELQDARAQAATDALTGLRNHRAFQEKVREEIARAEGNGSPLGLIMMDIDGFKHVNDSRGHLVGDSILRDLASSLTDHVGRESAYRYGGDEFALLLPGVDRRKTATVAEQLRRAVENQAAARRSPSVWA